MVYCVLNTFLKHNEVEVNGLFCMVNNSFLVKKRKNQNHKYDSVMDATPAPASSITPKPFKVIPIAAKV